MLNVLFYSGIAYLFFSDGSWSFMRGTIIATAIVMLFTMFFL